MPILFCQPDVAFLRPFVAAAKQNNQCPVLLPKINPVARTVIHAQFGHTFANRFAVTQISLSHTRQPCEHSCNSTLVVQIIEPDFKWRVTGVGTEHNDFFWRDQHRHNVAFELQLGKHCWGMLAIGIKRYRQTLD